MRVVLLVTLALSLDAALAVGQDVVIPLKQLTSGGREERMRLPERVRAANVRVREAALGVLDEAYLRGDVGGEADDGDKRVVALRMLAAVPPSGKAAARAVWFLDLEVSDFLETPVTPPTYRFPAVYALWRNGPEGAKAALSALEGRDFEPAQRERLLWVVSAVYGSDLGLVVLQSRAEELEVFRVELTDAELRERRKRAARLREAQKDYERRYANMNTNRP